MARKKLIVNYNKIEQHVWQLAEPLAAQCGAELIDVEYVKEAGSWYMRLYIDREPPVDHALCEQVSNLVSEALDKDDPVEEAYFLEISSPGLERPLRRASDFSRFRGHAVIVRLYSPRNGKKEYEGLLCGWRDGAVIINVEGEELAFPEEEVARARLKADI